MHQDNPRVTKGVSKISTRFRDGMRRAGREKKKNPKNFLCITLSVNVALGAASPLGTRAHEAKVFETTRPMPVELAHTKEEIQ